MTCGYCDHANSMEATRCEKCGRKLSGAGITIVPEAYGNSYGNAAPQLQLRSENDPQAASPNAKDPRASARDAAARDEDFSKKVLRQANLFPVQEARRVIPFESISPEAATQVRTTVQRNAKARSHHRLAQRLGIDTGSDSSLPVELQQKLSFPKEKVPEAKVQPARYTDAPVALPAQRILAATYDGAMILMAVGILAVIHQSAGAQFATGTLNLGVYAGLIFVVSLFYRLLWAMGNGETPGAKAFGLRLLNFDGYAPTREQRILRICTSLISIASLGMGILWCFFDEERLTWHDEMSRTFPSPGRVD